MATFEVLALDAYAIETSSKRHELLSRLRSYADVRHDELTDEELIPYLWSGARVLNPNVTSWDGIKAIEEHAILLWASMQVTDYRMMYSSKFFPIDSRVGKTDPSQRVKNNVAIKRELRIQFEQYLEDNGIVIGDPGILVTEVVRENIVTDAVIPNSVQRGPDPLTIRLRGKTANTIDIEWDKAELGDFGAYTIYIDDEPNIEDPTQLEHADAELLGVRQDVTKVTDIYNQWARAVRINDLEPSTYYYIVVAICDRNGRTAISNELRVKTSS